MINKDKEILLRDLSARLPYGVKIKLEGIVMPQQLHWSHISTEEDWELPKPYLRPMSSMTEEEKEELKSLCYHVETEEDWEGVRSDVWCINILDKYDTRRWDNPIWPSTINMDAIDWLNKHHFDYRGLIPKGLALEATKDMYDNQ